LRHSVLADLRNSAADDVFGSVQRQMVRYRTVNEGSDESDADRQTLEGWINVIAFVVPAPSFVRNTVFSDQEVVANIPLRRI